MKENLTRHLKYMVVLLAGSALAGTLLLTLVFCLPTDRIEKHVAQSVDRILRNEEDFPQNAFLRHVWRDKESYTDSIMVQYAFERLPDKNAFEHAMWAYHYDLEEEIWAAEDSLRAVLAGTEPSQMHLREYSRYWHGYLLYLKPLLLIFSWEQLVWLGAGLQLALLVAVAVFSVRRRCAGVIAAMAAGLLFMKPELMAISLTMSVCCVITLVAVVILLLKGDWLRERRLYPEFFLCIGILTAYFDFLTYPIVTLGFPLCVYFCVTEPEKIVETLKRIVGYGFCWGVGYAGMWASKWVIADLTLHTGTIRDAVWNVIGRTEAIGGRPRMNGGFYVISLNLQEYGSVVYAVLAAALGVVTVGILLWALCRGRSPKTLAVRIVPFLIIALIPFAWIVVVQHHSALHARFTFRILGVSAMALGCVCVQAIQILKHKNVKD